MPQSRVAPLLVGVSLFALLGAHAHAQTAAVAEPPATPTAPAAAQDGAQLSEIIVTAQRQAQNLQRTPVSVTAIGGDQVTKLGLDDVQKLSQQVPGLAVKSDFGAVNPNIYIRGVGIGDFNANVTGAVGVYVDEVYISSPAAQLSQFYDTDRLEVLRGPQGTLYGRNTTGGAINIFSRRPTDHVEGDFYGEYGAYNGLKLEGGVGGPIAPGLSGRISGLYQRRDGVLDNAFGGGQAPGHLNDQDNWALRAQVLYKPSDRLSVLVNAHGSENHTTGGQFQHWGTLNPAAFAKGQLVPCSTGRIRQGGCVDSLGYADTDGDPQKGQYNDPSREDAESWGVDVNTRLDLGRYTITSISAYETTHRFTQFDGDESPNTLLVPMHEADSEQISQELRIASPAKERFRWVAGGYYFHENLTFAGSFDLFPTLRPAISAAANALGLGAQFPNGFNPTGGPALAAQLGNPVFAYPASHFNYGYKQMVDSWALFGQAYYDLTDALTATAGIRYSTEDRRFDYLSALTEPGFAIPLVQTSRALGNDRTSFSDPSFRAALEWKATRDVFAYASISRGDKSGGFNGALLTGQAQAAPFKDETITAYETGVKTEWLDRRLRINATGFYYSYDNLQDYILVSTGGIPQQVLTNAGSAEVYGGEFEVLIRPIAPLIISLGASLLHAKFTQFSVDPQVGVPAGTNFTGNDLPFAPTFTTTGLITYEKPVGRFGTLVLQTDYSYQGSAFSDARDLAVEKTQPAFLLGARIALRSPDKRWELAAFGRNITNRQYVTYVADLADFGYYRAKYNDPATYGVSLSLRF